MLLESLSIFLSLSQDIVVCYLAFSHVLGWMTLLAFPDANVMGQCERGEERSVGLCRSRGGR